MTTDEINRYIHEQIMGKCWHDVAIGPEPHCTLCHQIYDGLRYYERPDYCSDESPRSLLNEVICTVGIEKVYNTALHPFIAHHSKSLIDRTNMYKPFGLTAEQIARACVAAHQEAK